MVSHRVEFSRYKWRHLTVFVLFLALASFLAFYIERPYRKRRIELQRRSRIIQDFQGFYMNNPLQVMAGGCIGSLVGIVGGFFGGFFLASGGNFPWSHFQEFGVFDEIRGWTVGLLCAFVGGVGLAFAGAVIGASKREFKEGPKPPKSTHS